MLTDVKSQFHTLIDEIDNPTLLQTFFDLFKARVNEPESKIWNTLSADEQQEVLEAFDESEKDSHLIGHETMKQKYQSWLKK